MRRTCLFIVTLAMSGLVLNACGLTAKDVEAGAVLINCIDDHLLAGDSPEKIVLACGPDAVKLIAGRQALARKRTPCTTVVVDAGPPMTGPGR